MSKRVLIIDDDADFADSLSLALSLREVESDIAGTGQDGVDKFAEGNYDITITDIKLPDFSGIEVLRQLRDKSAQAYVMVMTGFRSQDLLEEARRGGADEILLKPFRITELLDKVQRQLN